MSIVNSINMIDIYDYQCPLIKVMELFWWTFITRNSIDNRNYKTILYGSLNKTNIDRQIKILYPGKYLFKKEKEK